MVKPTTSPQKMRGCWRQSSSGQQTNRNASEAAAGEQAPHSQLDHVARRYSTPTTSGLRRAGRGSLGGPPLAHPRSGMTRRHEAVHRDLAFDLSYPRATRHRTSERTEDHYRRKHPRQAGSAGLDEPTHQHREVDHPPPLSTRARSSRSSGKAGPVSPCSC
jgi:hypothetical protein